MFIYTIRSKSNDFVIQIGSTRQPLRKRWSMHKAACKNTKNKSHLYNFIRENGGIDNFYIELYEELKDVTKQQLEKREGEIIREFKKNPEMYVLNHNIAGNKQGMTDAEYNKHLYNTSEKIREKKREKMRKYSRKYYERNKSSSSQSEDSYQPSIDPDVEQIQDLLLNEPDDTKYNFIPDK